MGRPERPVDQHSGPIAELAAQLRRLRDGAGRPSYRELARRASFSTTVLSEAAGGRTLPTLPVVKAYVRACGGDVDEWEERWRQLAAQLSEDRQENGQAAVRAPYLGLASYDVADADLYFGRDTLTAELLQRLTKSRFLAVFGSSGSGKSSLLRAGLMAAVARGEPGRTWTSAILTPGARPVAALAELVASLAGMPAETLSAGLMADPGQLAATVQLALADLPPDAELLLVVDQFEEVFGDCPERDCFVEALLAAVSAPDAKTRVVLGVRADFYGHCARWPQLVQTMRDAQVLVGPMGADDLGDAIVGPAARTGLQVERALVATVLADADAGPGALPLVSHALLETWRGSPRGRLTLAAYQAAGGVSRAIATTAEAVYADCDEEQQRIMRRVFLRLIALGDGGPDTRRRVAPGDLTAGSEPDRAAALVERLARARLITMEEGGVQIAHEALICSWPRLTEWLAEGRAGLRAQRGLADSAAAWAGFGRDPAALYRGTPLSAARAWAEQDGGRTGLTNQEQEFLNASIAADEAGRIAAARSGRRLRVLAATLMALLLAASVIGGVAVWQRQMAVAAEHAAQEAQRAAVSGQLAAQADALAVTNPDAASLAALAAWHSMPTVAARSALLSTAACCTSAQATLQGERGTVQAVAFSPDGRLLASGGKDHVLYLWNTATGRLAGALRGATGTIQAIAFSHRGDLIAAGSADGTIRLWDVAARRIRARLAGYAASLAFSPDDRLLASAQGGQVRLWDPVTGRAEQVLGTTGGQLRAVAFSPDGRTVAAAGADKRITLWDSTGSAHPREINNLGGTVATVTDLAYSPDGSVIAAAESNGGALLWDLARHTSIQLRGGTHGSRGLAFSADGTMLFSAASYSHLLLWDTATGQQVSSATGTTFGYAASLAYSPASDSIALGGMGGSLRIWRAPVPPFTGHTGPVTGVAVTPDGSVIASVSGDGTLRTWDRGGHLRNTVNISSPAIAVAISPDGRYIATGGTAHAITVSSLPDLVPRMTLPVPSWISDVAFAPDSHLLAASVGNTVTVWDTGTGQRRISLGTGYTRINHIAFSPDGRALAAVTNSGTVFRWTIRNGRRIASHGPVSGSLDAIVFSPDGRLLASAGNDGGITLWDAASLRRLTILSGPDAKVGALAFSLNGRTLAAAESDGTIVLWDTRDRSPHATLTVRKGPVRALAFTPDGSALISGGNFGRIIAWTLDPAHVTRQVCQTLAHDPDLTAAEVLVPAATYSLLCT